MKRFEHKEYKKIVEGADVAYIFVHGIVGTPNHFDFLMEYVPEDVSVWKLVLDGHGGKVEDFAHTSMKKWRAQVKAAIDELAEKHSRIYVVAHSMGTLLTMEQAIVNDKIVKMYWLQSPMYAFVQPRMFGNIAKIYWGNIREDDINAMSAYKCYGIGPSKNLFKYIGWVPRFLELLAQMRRARRDILLLKTPCVAIQADRDDVVSARSAKVLSKNPCITVHRLKKSGHFYYEAEEAEFMKSEFQRFVADSVKNEV